MDPALVLSGITRESDLQRYADKPHYLLRDVSEITEDCLVRITHRLRFAGRYSIVYSRNSRR